MRIVHLEKFKTYVARIFFRQTLSSFFCFCFGVYVALHANFAGAAQEDRKSAGEGKYNYNAVCLFSNIVLAMYVPKVKESFSKENNDFSLVGVERVNSGIVVEYYLYKKDNVTAEFSLPTSPSGEMFIDELEVQNPEFFRGEGMNKYYFEAIFEINSVLNANDGSSQITAGCDNSLLSLKFDRSGELSYLSVHVNSNAL